MKLSFVIGILVTLIAVTGCTKPKKNSRSTAKEDQPSEVTQDSPPEEAPVGIIGSLALEEGANPSDTRIVVQTFDNEIHTGTVDSEGNFSVEAPAPGVPFTLAIQEIPGTQLTDSASKTIAAINFNDLGYSQNFASAAQLSLSISANTQMKTASAVVKQAEESLVPASLKNETLPHLEGSYTVNCKSDTNLGTSDCGKSSTVLPTGFYLSQRDEKVSLWKSKANYDRCALAMDEKGNPKPAMRIKRTDLSPAKTEEFTVDFSTDKLTIESIGKIFAKLPTTTQKSITALTFSSPSGDCAVGSPGLDINPQCQILNDSASPFNGRNRQNLDKIATLFGRLLGTYSDATAQWNADDKVTVDSNGVPDCKNQQAPIPSWVTDLRDCKLDDLTSYSSSYPYAYQYIHSGDQSIANFCVYAAGVRAFSLNANSYQNPSNPTDPTDIVEWRHLKIDSTSGKFIYNPPVSDMRRFNTNLNNYEFVTTDEFIANPIVDKLRELCPTFESSLSNQSDLMELGNEYVKISDPYTGYPINLKQCFIEFGNMNLSQQIAAISRLAFYNANDLLRVACTHDQDYQAIASLKQDSCVPKIENAQECKSIDTGFGWSFNACAKRFPCQKGLGGTCDFRPMGFLASGAVESYGSKGFAMSTFAEYKTEDFIFPENSSNKDELCREYGITGYGCSVAWNNSCTHNDTFTFVLSPTESQFLVTLNQLQGNKCSITPYWTDGQDIKIPPEKSSSSTQTFLFDISPSN